MTIYLYSHNSEFRSYPKFISGVCFVNEGYKISTVALAKDIIICSKIATYNFWYSNMYCKSTGNSAMVYYSYMSCSNDRYCDIVC